MSEVYIVVEGQTEQSFIRDVLAPYLAPQGLYLIPSIIGTPGHKGGVIKFERAKHDIGLFLKQRPDTYVSTMFDYFRIDPAWPGYAHNEKTLKQGVKLSAGEKAQGLELETEKQIIDSFSPQQAEQRFIPYISMHEFEALLFSHADILADKTGIALETIQAIIAQYDNPEEINQSADNAPSKRLHALKRGYKKVLMGKVISEAIGIAHIRQQCPHFDAWLLRLENLLSSD